MSTNIPRGSNIGTNAVAWLHPHNPSCVTTDPNAYERGIPLGIIGADTLARQLAAAVSAAIEAENDEGAPEPLTWARTATADYIKRKNAAWQKVHDLVEQIEEGQQDAQIAGDQVAMIQMRCRGGSWREVQPTKAEPTPELRADYLMSALPGVYEVRRLYTAPPAAARVPLTPGEPVALLQQVRCALALASAVCDAVPTRDRGHIGILVNAQPDGAHGYRVIHDALNALDAHLTAQRESAEAGRTL